MSAVCTNTGLECNKRHVNIIDLAATTRASLDPCPFNHSHHQWWNTPRRGGFLDILKGKKVRSECSENFQHLCAQIMVVVNIVEKAKQLRT